MEERKCKKCPKVIQGYSKQHVDYLMMQHELVHRKKEKQKEEKEND